MNENYTERREKASAGFAGFFDILESLVYAIIAVVLVFIFFGRLSVVDGTSMDDTLSHGEYLIVVNPLFSYKPTNGDIVVIDGGDEFGPYDEPIVKRVIATEGQTLTMNFKDMTVFVDGELIEEEYAKYVYPYFPQNTSSLEYHNSLYNNDKLRPENRLFVQNGTYDPQTGIYSLTIPEDHFFAMGDNRLNSADSRFNAIGFIQEDFVVGKATFRLFPFSRMGGL